MRVVSLTIPKPTLSNDDNVKSISLTIKSRSNGMQVIDSWPYALPRFRYELDEILEISIYYTSRNRSDLHANAGVGVKSSSNPAIANSGEINLYSVVNFPCLLLKEIDFSGKKQWILGLDKFGEGSALISGKGVERALEEIKIMEEKARKSFEISKVYLIFYSCSKTVMNIEEQLGCTGGGNALEVNEKSSDSAQKRKPSCSNGNKAFLQEENRKISRYFSGGIRPEDSISRVSGKTSNSNTIARTNLIKQSLTENCESLSDAIEMINKYRNKSRGSFSRSMGSVENSNLTNSNNKVGAGKSEELGLDPEVEPKKRSSLRAYTSNLPESLRRDNFRNSELKGKVLNDTASVISRTISANTQKLLEKREVQEKLLRLQYCFSVWRQAAARGKSIRNSRKNVSILNGMVSLLKIFDRRAFSWKLRLISALRANLVAKMCMEKNNTIEKLNTEISESHINISAKEREVFELRKKLEYIDNLNKEFGNNVEDLKLENEKLAKESKELRSYVETSKTAMETEMNRYDRERQELEIILERRKKELNRHLEEINFLNAEITEMRNIVESKEEENEALNRENRELRKRCEDLKQEKNKNLEDYNQKMLMKNRENEELQLENIKFREKNDLLALSINKLEEENCSFKTVCDELSVEKSSLISSVYELISQIENEKIERIQELENSRMLFQSINNSKINASLYRGMVGLEEAVDYKNEGRKRHASSPCLFGSRGSGSRLNSEFYRSPDLEFDQDPDELRLEDLRNTGFQTEANIEPAWDACRFELEVVGDVNRLEIPPSDKVGAFQGLEERGTRVVKKEAITKNVVFSSCVEITEREPRGTVEKRVMGEVKVEIMGHVYTGDECCFGNGFTESKQEQDREKQSENEKMMKDLTERVKFLTEEIAQLKESEKKERIRQEERGNGEQRGICGPFATGSGLTDQSFPMDETERIIGSATEMFKLALRNIKMSGNTAADIADTNEKSVNTAIAAEENEEIAEKEDRSQALAIIPSEFSFSTNYQLSSNGKEPGHVEKEGTEKRRSSDIYHQYTVENKVNNSVNSPNAMGNSKNSIFKLGYDKLVSSISSTLGVQSSAGSPVKQSKENKLAALPKLGSTPSQAQKILSSPSASPVISRSNSMRYYSNPSFNSNMSGGTCYYQYSSGEYSNLVVPSGGGSPHPFTSQGQVLNQKWRNAPIPKQANNGLYMYHQVRTIPPPFFPRS
ncbi:hypothetical protein HWI79_1918 [Cryptosporidium felis]|nr:hypothetical protein HWI79_1918 [Cryptosporidium felis]